MMNMCKLSAICVGVWMCVHSLSYGDTDSYQQEQKQLQELKEELQRAKENRQIAENAYNGMIAYRNEMMREHENAKANNEDSESRAESVLETMKQLDDLSEVADLTEAVDTFTEIVENAKEENGVLTAKRYEKVKQRTAKTTKVANETETLAALDKQNSDFAANYRKNTVEYPVTAVVPGRSFVLFTVPAESGIERGTALLVMRGDNIVATLFVEKKSGNQVIAKYTLAPGQAVKVGDKVIHARPR